MKHGLIFSIIAHLVVISFLSYKFNFQKKSQIDLTSAVRVDMVALPNKKNDFAMPTKNQTPPAPTPKPAPETVKDIKKENLPLKDKKTTQNEKEINLKKSKQKQQDALKKLQKQAALEKIKEDLAKEKTKPSAQPIKGEVISAGTRPFGIAKMEYDIFLAQIDSTIKSNWSLPQWLMDLPLQARVNVRIEPTGKLITAQISRSSGNPSYDEFCVAAVEKSAPFPEVPTKFAEIFKVDGFKVGFPD